MPLVIDFYFPTTILTGTQQFFQRDRTRRLNIQAEIHRLYRLQIFSVPGKSELRVCHLKRVIGNTCLHYDHFMTMLRQIEGVLNSKELCLSSGPDDFASLTRAHLLIGRTLIFLFLILRENRLKLYKFLQLLQNFWYR